MDIRAIMQKIDLEQLLNRLGLKNIVSLDDNFMFSCYFHKDDKPSCGIHKRTGAYNCFSCGARGNLITLVAEIKSINFKEALLYLYGFAGIREKILSISLKTINKQIKKIISPHKIKNEEKEQKRIVGLPLDTNNKFIHGIEYFSDRGINKEVLQRHNITFCMSGFYKNRAIIPIYNENKKLISFEARDLTGMAEKKALYPKGININNTLYNLQNTKQNKDAIVVEGLMDVLYLSQRGFDAISTYGANISKKQEGLLNKYFKKIYIAYDGDRTGRAATIRCGKLLNKHISVYIIILPRGSDPDNLTQRQFLHLYNGAVHLDDYLLNRLLNKI